MSEIEATLNAAFDAYNDARYDRAEDLTRQVLEITPACGDALYLLGLIAFRAGALEPAEKLLFEAVKLYPDQESYALALASVLQKENRLDEALGFYQKYPQNALAVAQIGYVYLQKGQTDFAKSAFQKAIGMDETCLTAHIGQALCLRRIGDGDGALALLTEAAKIGQSAELSYQLAVQKRLSGLYEAALSDIDEALSGEQTASFYNEKGLILEALHDLDGAWEAYETATKTNPYAPDGFANLGHLSLMAGKDRAAEDYYKKALALDDSFLNAHHNLAIVLCRQGRKAEGLEHYRSALVVAPNHIPTLYNLAAMLEEMGDYSEAAGLYFNILALKAQPADIEFRIANTLAFLYAQGKKDAAQALDFAKGWVKHFPDSVVARHTLNALTHNTNAAVDVQDYVRQLYDSFAQTYDETMARLEAASLPTLKAYLQAHPDQKTKRVLDLGCGTGTLADYLTAKPARLVGVDLSGAMLDKARQKEAYTDLHEADVISFLKAHQEKYDVIVISEVSGYLPALSALIELLPAHLSAGGLVVLSIENASKENVYLSEQGRYLYRPSYVENLLKKAGLTRLEKQSIKLRREGTAYAEGTCFFAGA